MVVLNLFKIAKKDQTKNIHTKNVIDALLKTDDIYKSGCIYMTTVI